MRSESDAATSSRGESDLRLKGLLAVLTTLSVFATQFFQSRDPFARAFADAGAFTLSLMAILFAHEGGHYVAARLHRVRASLPFFLPLPFVSPFGTMGAVIQLQERIASRKALLDIGAAGPLSGLCVAVPLYLWGVRHSGVVLMADVVGKGGAELGEPLLVRWMHWLVAPQMPPGAEIMLSPVAFAAWVGFFLTMVNLLPVWELDGGHVAYALFGKKQHGIGRFVHRAMLVFFFVSLGSFVTRDLRHGLGFVHFGRHVGNSFFWLFWFELLGVLGSLRVAGALSWRVRIFSVVGLAVLAQFGRESAHPLFWTAWFFGLGILLWLERRSGTLRHHAYFDHAPTSEEPLGAVRTGVAILTLVIFVLLFMPVPILEVS